MDAEGDWYYGNRLIFRKEILQTFYEHLAAETTAAISWSGRGSSIRSGWTIRRL